MTKTFVTSFSFGIAIVAIIIAFVTATNYAQLGLAIVLYPVLIYYAFKTFPRKANGYAFRKATTAYQSTKPVEKPEAVKRENVGISDIDKRAFLKLIGGAGITLFLFSLFNRRTEGLFPGIAPAGSGLTSLKDVSGNKINPAKSQPTDGYRISEIDDDEIGFFGFTNEDGGWYISRVDTDTGSFRYTKGNSNFPLNWANRNNLKYDYYNNVFRN